MDAPPSSALNAAALARTAAVMGDRRHVANGGDLEADRLEGAQRRLTARARTANLNLEDFHAVILSLAAGIFGGNLGGIRRRLARALEALRTRRRPRDR